MEILKVNRTEEGLNIKARKTSTLEDMYAVSLSLIDKIIELYPDKKEDVNFVDNFFILLKHDYNKSKEGE